MASAWGAAAPKVAEAGSQQSKASASVQPLAKAAQPLALGRKNLAEGRLLLAEQYLATAAKEVEKQPASLEQYEAFYLYGQVLGAQSQHNQALNYHFKAKQTAETLRDEARQAQALKAVGQDLLALDDPGQAELFLRKASKLYLAAGDARQAAQCLAAMGECYIADRQPARAAGAFRQAMGLFAQAQDLPGQVASHQGLARTQLEQGALPEAINQLQITLGLADSARLPEVKAEVYLILAEAYDKSADEAKAIFYANIGLSLGQRYKLLPLQERAHLQLSNYHTAKGDDAKALRHYKNYVALKERITNDVRNRQLAQVRLKYENEKRGKEIAVLTREKRIQELDLTRKENLLWAGIGIILLLGIMAVLLQRKNMIERAVNAKLHANNLKIEQQRDQIEQQKLGLTEALGQLESSIQYAKRIQDAILAASAPLHPFFKDPLIYYRPKAIVSGDFYWASHQGPETVVVVADCTGHGVPGAFLSLVGHSTLVRALAAVPSLDPALILTFIDQEISRTLGNQPGLDIKEGIEMSICVLNRTTRQLRFAGARRDALVVAGGHVHTLAGSRRSVGGIYARLAPAHWQFGTQNLTMVAGSSLYLLTDGYTDQHNADGQAKFGLPRLRDLILKTSALSAQAQTQALDQALTIWRADTDQTDDILVVGLRVE